MKKTSFFILISFVFIISVRAQIEHPILWLRADSCENNAMSWRDISGNEVVVPFLSDTAMNPDSYLNFNPSFYFSDGTAFHIPSLEIKQKRYNVFIVYEIDTAALNYMIQQDSVAETNVTDSISNGSNDSIPAWMVDMPLWKFDVDSNNHPALTTQFIYGKNTAIRYCTTNTPIAMVNSLSVNWRDSEDTISCNGVVAANDRNFFVGKIAEFVVIPCSEYSETEVAMWNTYLTVKYGVTLLQTDFIDSYGDIVWPYDSMSNYAAFISGLGRDDYFGLYQKQSYFADKQMIVGFNSLAETNALNTAHLAEGDYIVIGTDSSAFRYVTDLYLDEGVTLPRYGDALVRATGDSVSFFPSFIQVNANGWEGDLNNYVLMLDRSGSGQYADLYREIYLPTKIDTIDSVLIFNDLYWDTDYNGIDRFCFATLAVAECGAFSERSFTVEADASTDSTDNAAQTVGEYLIYPNPCREQFFVEARFEKSTPLRIAVYAEDGRLVKSVNRGSAFSHITSVTLPTKGQYLIELSSDIERYSTRIVRQ